MNFNEIHLIIFYKYYTTIISIKKKKQIFKGLNQTHIIHLNEKPSAITAVYTDNSEHHIPCKTSS